MFGSGPAWAREDPVQGRSRVRLFVAQSFRYGRAGEIAHRSRGRARCGGRGRLRHHHPPRRPRRCRGEPAPASGAVLSLLALGATGYGLSLRLYLLAQRRIGAARTGSVFAAGIATLPSRTTTSMRRMSTTTTSIAED